MKPSDFVKNYYPFAKQTQDKTGISAVAILAQAAWESGWGEHAPGNMFFGVKDTDGINGNEQLLVTTEISRYPNAKLPRIIKVVPITRNGQKYFEYTIEDYFRKYNSPEESFTDHAKFFLVNKNYKRALLVKDDPYKFIDEIALAGYATEPTYAASLKSSVKFIEDEIKKQKL